MSVLVEERARHILRSYSPQVVARGRVYAEEGRVRDVRVDADGVSAVVNGSEAYRVDVLASKKVPSSCTCPAFAREGECKHVAALAWTVHGVLRTPRGPAQALPAVFSTVYSAATFFSRLSVYAGERIRHDIDAYVPLTDWWRRASTSASEPLRARVIDAAPELEQAIETVRQWRRPRSRGKRASPSSMESSLGSTKTA